MDQRITKLEIEVAILKESMNLNKENIVDKLDNITQQFLQHDEKEMKKYDEIKTSINNQNYKIGALFLIISGALNLDKITPYLSIFGF